MKAQRSSYVLTIVCLAALLVVLMFVAGCTSTGTTATTPASAGSAPTTAAQTETLTLTGSTTVLPIAQAVADVYMQAHPEANIQVSGGGSGVGIQAIINQKVDIGMSSADVSAAQKAQDSTMNIITIAHDGIAIIVNPETRSRRSPLTRSKRSTTGASPRGLPYPGQEWQTPTTRSYSLAVTVPPVPVPILISS